MYQVGTTVCATCMPGNVLVLLSHLSSWLRREQEKDHKNPPEHEWKKEKMGRG